MRFGHVAAVRERFDTLAAAVLLVDVHADGDAAAVAGPFLTRARERLEGTTESALPEIQAWRRAFAAMGLKPTQYRCASESLLRRLRREDTLPGLHPVVDVANAVSTAFAVPVAVLDLDHVTGDLLVQPATGSEDYLTFGGEHEHPEPGEIVFVDAAGHAHARRWTNRQSGLSAVRDGTRRALVIAEALHDTAARDVAQLSEELAGALTALGCRVHASRLLTQQESVVELASR